MAGAAPPRGTMRMVWSGPVSTQDTWSTSLWSTVGTLAATPSQAEINTIASTGLAAFQANIFATGKLQGIMAAATQLTTCTVYFYDGTSSAAAAQGVATQTATAGNGTTLCPAYTSMVASLGTSHAGRSGRGRMYLPTTALALTAGTLQSSAPSSITSCVKGLLSALTVTMTVGGSSVTNLVGVQSRKNNTLYLVTSISCDSIPDTQHGRLNKDVATTKSVVAFP